jgi:hypothetical protein
MALPPEVARRRRHVTLLKDAFSHAQIRALSIVLNDLDSRRDECDPLIEARSLLHDAANT